MKEKNNQKISIVGKIVWNLTKKKRNFLKKEDFEIIKQNDFKDYVIRIQKKR